MMSWQMMMRGNTDAGALDGGDGDAGDSALTKMTRRAKLQLRAWEEREKLNQGYMKGTWSSKILGFLFFLFFHFVGSWETMC